MQRIYKPLCFFWKLESDARIWMIDCWHISTSSPVFRAGDQSCLRSMTSSATSRRALDQLQEHCIGEVLRDISSLCLTVHLTARKKLYESCVNSDALILLEVMLCNQLWGQNYRGLVGDKRQWECNHLWHSPCLHGTYWHTCTFVYRKCDRLHIHFSALLVICSILTKSPPWLFAIARFLLHASWSLIKLTSLASLSSSLRLSPSLSLSSPADACWGFFRPR